MTNFFNIEKLFTFFNYVFWFFILNLVFLVVNIPAVAFFMFIGISNIGTYLPLFLLALIPFGPSFTMLLYCTGKLIRNKDLDLFQDIKQGFKLNFKQSTLIWIVELIIIFALNTNIRFFSRYSPILSGIFVLLSIVLLLTSPYIYVLISRFSLSTKALIKNVVILAFTRPLISIGNVLAMVFTMILFEISPGTTFLFMGSILAFLINYCNKFLITELEASSSDNNSITN